MAPTPFIVQAPEPTAAHLKALAHGLVALESRRQFPTLCPPRPELEASTLGFLARLEAHVLEKKNVPGHSVETCKGCGGVNVVRQFNAQCLQLAIHRGDQPTVSVLSAIDQMLAQKMDA